MLKRALLLLPFALFASDENLIQKVNDLETQIAQMKKQLAIVHDDLHENFSLIEKVETKSILDRINLSPELELRFDKMDYDLGQIEGENTLVTNTTIQRRDEFKKSFAPAAAIRFRLNMQSKFDEYTTFHGRILYSNSTQAYERLCILSYDIKSASASNSVELDRAYIDFTPNKGSEYATTLSFGILPTSGGTPMQFAQNAQRKSMFPALVFDMNSYGVIATQKFGSHNYLRAIAAKGFTLDAASYAYQCNRENIDNASIFGLYFDSKLSMQDLLFSAGINMLHDLKAHPYLGPDVTAENAEVLGDYITLGVGIDSQNIFDTGLTLFAHTALSMPKGNDKIDDYLITPSNPDGFSTASYAKGGMVSSSGFAAYVGAKYDATRTLDLGLEYNYGSKYWFSATQGAEDKFNKLATRGHVGEVYALWGFHRYLSAKLGYLYTKEEFTGSGWHFGEPVSKDGKQRVAYLSLQAKY